MIAITVVLTGNLDANDTRAAKFALSNAGITIPTNPGQLRTAYQDYLTSQVVNFLHAATVKNALAKAKSSLDLTAFESAMVDATPQKQSAAIAAALAVLA